MPNKLYQWPIIIFILLILFIPALEGFLFKREYLQLIKAINTQTNFNIELLDYKQSWFNSYAKLRLSYSRSNTTLPADLIVIQHISHGPITYNPILKRLEFGDSNIRSDIHLDSPYEAVLLNQQTDFGLMQISILNQFFGDWRGQIIIPNITLPVKNEGSLDWDGLNGNFSIILKKDNLKRVLINLDIHPIYVTSQNNPTFKKIFINNINYQYQLVHQSSGLWSGQVNFYTQLLQIRLANNANIEAQELHAYSAFSAANDKFYNTNLTVNVDKILTGSLIIPQLSQFHIRLSANDFSSQHVNEAILLLKYLTPKDLQAFDFTQLEPFLTHTIIPTSLFYIEASSNTSLGPFSANAKINLKENANIPDTFNEVINQTYANIDVTASIPIVTKIISLYGDITKEVHPNQNNLQKTTDVNELIESMLHGDYLIRKPEGYATTIVVDGGVWKIKETIISPNKTKTTTEG